MQIIRINKVKPLPDQYFFNMCGFLCGSLAYYFGRDRSFDNSRLLAVALTFDTTVNCFVVFISEDF
jgi:glycopeptide antibiotics resistance protein